MINVNTGFPIFFKHIADYTSITGNDFEDIITYFTKVNLKKGDALIRMGDKVDNTYWVLKGLLISNYTDDTGNTYVIQFANEGCWITDQQAFYYRGRAIFDIICLEHTELFSISFEDREKLCSDIPKMGDFFRKKINESYVKQQKRLLTYMTKDATERFNILRNDYPELFQRVSKKLLAAYLGVSRETLSRLKK
ncbi:MAG: Crp/Fnr family transcriptional regulator [Bacteroidales bacterium]|nr:Crp/Fnr family transcriptional regulator [Bacteroidales bacterium]